MACVISAGTHVGRRPAPHASPSARCARGAGHAAPLQWQRPAPAGRAPLRLRGARRAGPQKLVVLAGSGTGEIATLPIFPLSMVALPSADVPLQIFEARYRVLFSTLLAGAEGLEEGLINHEKPWCGTRRFGMSFFDPQQKGLASVGTVLEIKEHARLDDGRLVVQNIGRERFRIRKIVEEAPVLICEVEYLPSEDKEEHSEEVKQLAAEVSQLFRNVIQLAVKLRDTTLTQELADPSQLTELGPSQLSFWVASLFSGNPYQQQALLEMESTKERLEAEQELLSGTQKYLSAQAALAGAFRFGSGTEEEAPPKGGPD